MKHRSTERERGTRGDGRDQGELYTLLTGTADESFTILEELGI
jgi:hypothetical protein